MGKRGRKPAFRPIPPQTPGASYRLYVPGKGVISLETSDEKEAWTKAGEYSQNYAAGGMNSPPKVSPFEMGPPVGVPDGTKNAATFQPPTAKEMLSTWQTQSPTLPTEPFVSSQPTPSPSQSFVAQSPTESLPPQSSLSVSDKVNAVMPPEKRAKIAGMLAKGITLINVAGTAWCVKLLGTIPKIDDEDEAKDVLKIGWELQLEELFVNHPPEPWMVIAGGTAALFVGMLVNGERVVKDKRPKPPESPKVGFDLDEPPQA